MWEYSFFKILTSSTLRFIVFMFGYSVPFVQGRFVIVWCLREFSTSEIPLKETWFERDKTFTACSRFISGSGKQSSNRPTASPQSKNDSRPQPNKSSLLRIYLSLMSLGSSCHIHISPQDMSFPQIIIYSAPQSFVCFARCFTNCLKGCVCLHQTKRDSSAHIRFH